MIKFISLLVFVCVGFGAKGQLLWEISGKGVKKKSYLFGTMHVGDARIQKIGDAVKPEVAACEVMAGELKFDVSTIFQSFSVMFMPPDTTLKDLLPEDKYLIVKTKIDEKLGGIGAFAEKIRPMFLSTMLQEETSGVKKKGSNFLPLDMYLQNYAMQKDLEVIGLETVEEQVGALSSIPLKEQAELLYDELVSPSKKDENSIETLITLYTQQALDSLYNLSTASMNNKTAKAMLDERNVRMADRMAKIMKKQTLFAAVGAAHLGGKEGVIELLRRKGFKVKPIQK